MKKTEEFEFAANGVKHQKKIHGRLQRLLGESKLHSLVKFFFTTRDGARIIRVVIHGFGKVRALGDRVTNFLASLRGDSILMGSVISPVH